MGQAAPDAGDGTLDQIRQLLVGDETLKRTGAYQGLVDRLDALETRLDQRLSAVEQQIRESEERQSGRHATALGELSNGLRALADHVERLASGAGSTRSGS